MTLLRRLRRPRSWRVRILVVTVVVLAALLTGVGVYTVGSCRSPVCDPVALPPAGLRITTGGPGGVYAAYAQVYADGLRRDVPGLRVQLLGSGGSIDNIHRLVNGTAQVGFISADTAFALSEAEAKAHAFGRVRAVARVYDEYVQVVVRSDSPFRTLADLKGRRVSTGSPGSSVEITAQRLLSAAGLNDPTDITRSREGVRRSAQLLLAGKLDAFFWVGGLGTQAVTDLADRVRVRLLPVDKYIEPLRERYGTVYRTVNLPATTYPRVLETATIAVPSYLLATTRLDDDVVERLTRSLFTNRTRIATTVPSGRVLDVRSATNTASIQLHPGAIRYYRSVKP